MILNSLTNVFELKFLLIFISVYISRRIIFHINQVSPLKIILIVWNYVRLKNLLCSLLREFRRPLLLLVNCFTQDKSHHYTKISGDIFQNVASFLGLSIAASLYMTWNFLFSIHKFMWRRLCPLRFWNGWLWQLPFFFVHWQH